MSIFVCQLSASSLLGRTPKLAKLVRFQTGATSVPGIYWAARAPTYPSPSPLKVGHRALLKVQRKAEQDAGILRQSLGGARTDYLQLHSCRLAFF